MARNKKFLRAPKPGQVWALGRCWSLALEQGRGLREGFWGTAGCWGSVRGVSAAPSWGGRELLLHPPWQLPDVKVPASLLPAVPGRKLPCSTQGAGCWGAVVRAHGCGPGAPTWGCGRGRQGTGSPALGPEVAVSSHLLFSRSSVFLLSWGWCLTSSFRCCFSPLSCPLTFAGWR